jgi:hypothetical protein
MAELVEKPIITKKIIDKIFEWSELCDELKFSKTKLIMDILSITKNINEEHKRVVENIEKGIDPKIIINQNEVTNAFNDIVRETGTKDKKKIKLLKRLVYLKFNIDGYNALLRQNRLSGGLPAARTLEELEINKKKFIELVPSISDIFVWDDKNEELEEFFCLDDIWKLSYEEQAWKKVMKY